MSRTRCIWGFTLTAVAALQACGGSGESPITGPPAVKAGFTLSAPSTIALLQGGGGEVQVSVARATGFTGAVTLAVLNAPQGVTTVFTPSFVAGALGVLSLTTSAAVPIGTFSITITGNADGVATQTVTTTVSVGRDPGGTGNVRVDFSTCSATDKPVWFAYQDGTGAWTQTLGSQDSYRFNVAGAKGGYAFVSGAGKVLTVFLATQAELTASTVSYCGQSPGTKTVTGSFTGAAATDEVFIGLGGPNPDPNGGPLSSNPFTLSAIESGPQDLVAYRGSLVGVGSLERAIIRRDQNITNNGSLALIDFASAEAFVPVSATLTVTGAGGFPVNHFMSYLTGPACSYHDLYSQGVTAAPVEMRGIPAAQQRPTDFHTVNVYTSSASAYRVAAESFHTMANRTVALPVELPAPTITVLPGPYKRIQMNLALPAEYSREVLLGMFGQASSTYVEASLGWLGSSNVSLAIPDLSAATGWRSSYLAAAGTPVTWIVDAEGATVPAASGQCVEGARFVAQFLSGQV